MNSTGVKVVVAVVVAVVAGTVVARVTRVVAPHVPQSTWHFSLNMAGKRPSPTHPEASVGQELSSV